MKTVLGTPIERVELGAHAAVVVQCVENPSRPGHFLLDIRLDHCDGEAIGRVPQPTAAGFRLPLHWAEELAESIVKVAGRGAQAALWGVGSSGRTKRPQEASPEGACNEERNGVPQLTA